jgi:signal transduction histidine kinase/ActR/RegA family two-component response regulator
MTATERQAELAAAREQIRLLQAELAETNRGLTALTMELEQRVDERTARLTAAVQDLEREIAERKRVELELRESEDRFRISLLHSPIGVYNQDRDLRYIWGHNRHPHFGGPDPIGKTDREIFGPDDGALLEAIKREVMATRIGRREEVKVRIGGAEVFFDLTVEPMRDASGDIAGVTSATLDITEQKQAEVQLRELNAALATRAEHLRTLASELTQTEDRERRRLARVLHDHLQQLLVAAKFSMASALLAAPEAGWRERLTKVNELLDQSIAAARSLTAELAPPILYDGTMNDALRWLVRWMQEKHDFTVALEGDERIDVPLDTRLLLFQAVRELLFNAVKHAAVDRARVRLERADRAFVRVTVADEGRGFDPLHSAAHEKSTGGFGLFNIRERLEWIGGRLEIDSAPGRGTRVAAWAPLQSAGAIGADAPSPAPPATRVAPAAAPGAALRVMIADDHRIVREGLARLLNEAAEIELVGQAEDGQQAVEMARRLQPDVVVMDVSMPRMNGIDATRIITAERPQCRVIALSMHSAGDMEPAMRDAGAAAYLPKDGPADGLIAAIRSGARRAS